MRKNDPASHFKKNALSSVAKTTLFNCIWVIRIYWAILSE
ncbi:hypothetical protein HMPREF9554_01729 [Treponema phagedenis F0421]|nr:hypothetical protein HMPREF9554_01729 [Treponema phagedenis F0421]